MGIFTTAESVAISHQCERDIKDLGKSDIPYTRPMIQGAVQAVRNILDSNAFRTTVSDAIDTATSPLVMTNAEKKRLFGRVIERMFRIEVA